MSNMGERGYSFRLRIALMMLGFVILGGTLSYTFVEKWSLSDSLYMTLITLSTVGFGEVHPLSMEGRIVTLVIILCGVGIGAFAIGTITEMILEGRIREILGRRKLEKQLQNLKDHFIICGYGMIGSVICDEVGKSKRSFVIIEKKEELVKEIEKKGYLYILGDATDDEVLLRAGIKTARSLISAITSDADNVFITLTAKELNPKIFIVSRASDAVGERRLRRAGANKVISPDRLGGYRMAQAVLRPAVVEFIELTHCVQDIELTIDEVEVQKGSQVADSTLKESGIREKTGMVIVAIEKSSGEMDFNPSAGAKIEAGDRLVTIGSAEQLKDLINLVTAKKGTPKRGSGGET